MGPQQIILFNVFAYFLLAVADLLVWAGLPNSAAHIAAALSSGLVSLIVWGTVSFRKRRESSVLTLTPKELLDTFKGQTELKIETLKESYIGKTLTVTSTVAAINPSPTTLDFPFLRTTLVVLESSPVRCLFHGKSSRRKLEDYDLGQGVTITGRIAFVDDLIGMKKCTIKALPAPRASSDSQVAATPTPSIILPPRLRDLLTLIGTHQNMASGHAIDFEPSFAKEHGEDLESLQELKLIRMDIGSFFGFPQYTNVHLTEVGRAILGVG